MRTEVRGCNWKPPFSHQWEAFSFTPKGGFGLVALLGGWGSGKTHGAARTFFRWACENGWHEDYGTDQPQGFIISPTAQTLRAATLREWEKVLPRDTLLKRRLHPNNDYTLTNGFYVKGYSAEAELEGVTASVGWIDEISHSVFSNNPTKFLNYMARLRDNKAKRRIMIVSGLPTHGWVRETFDKQEADWKVLLAPSSANTEIPESTLEAFKMAVGQEEALALLDGQWMSPVGTIYTEFSTDNLTEKDANPNRPVHFGLDVGERGGAVFAQDIDIQCHGITGQPVRGREKGLLVFDQMLFSDQSVEEMCYRIRTEGNFRILPGQSKICVDPTIRRDELHAIQKHFPGVHVVRKRRGDSAENVEWGVRQTKRAFCDALGNRRLLLHKRLAQAPYKNGFGLMDGIERYRRRDNGTPVKDNMRDHVLDCLRYLVVELIPAEKPGIRVRHAKD